MMAGIEIGQNIEFELQKALLIYSSGQNIFITEHDVTRAAKGQAPGLDPARLLTTDFVNSLVESLGGRADSELLSENILAKGSHSITWWTPAQRRRMFFQNAEGKAKDLNGKMFPHPPLVWKAANGQLVIRALCHNKRPVASTRLAVAPYWNVSDNGSVCLGSMRNPGNSSVSAVAEWEKGFYESAFTHSNVGRSTRHKDGFEGLWRSLAGKKQPFPRETLIPSTQTLLQFLSEKA